MLLMQLETVSVDELAVASVKAATMPAQPDTETLDEQHDRICADMAAGVQKKYLNEHYGSIASDHAIAVTLSQTATAANAASANAAQPLVLYISAVKLLLFSLLALPISLVCCCQLVCLLCKLFLW